MTTITRYDAYMLAKVECFVTWCEEWLSITQTRLEIGCILGYVGTCGWEHFAKRQWGHLLCDGIVLLWMWDEHLKTSSQRRAQAHDPLYVICRIFTQSVFVISILFICLEFGLVEVQLLAITTFAALFLLLIAINSGGEPGRKRKLALAKLKELFGVGWMPEPVGNFGLRNANCVTGESH